MRLRLDRQVHLVAHDRGLARVTTECHRSWSRGWVARLVGGKRSFLRESDARLSHAGNGARHFVIAAPGNYEADSVCGSYRSHRVRFDVTQGGVIVLRRSPSADRCGHLRAVDRLPTLETPAASPLEFASSLAPGEDSFKAALVLGGVLERHLRYMCEDRGLGTGQAGWAKGISDLSSALKKAGAYPSEQHKAILRLAALRKEAQHEGKSVSPNAVMSAAAELHDFCARHPATTPVSSPAHEPGTAESAEKS